MLAVLEDADGPAEAVGRHAEESVSKDHQRVVVSRAARDRSRGVLTAVEDPCLAVFGNGALKVGPEEEDPADGEVYEPHHPLARIEAVAAGAPGREGKTR